jgi:solute carrier family 25 carnitine/acylcarnitine transporter 20/29
VTTPVELVKARMQILHDRGGGGARDTWTMFRMATAGGIRGCFRGFGITVMRDIPGSAIYYGAYEWARGLMGGKDAGVGGSYRPF